MKALVKLLLVVAFSSWFVSEAQAQVVPAPPPLVPVETMNLSGPRIGMTVLSDGVRAKLLEEHRIELGPMISQFGWQKEKRFLSSPTGFTGVSEFVFLVGGMDQGVLIPSVNWLVGARTAEGLEFAVGPNVTPAGIALAAAAGVTFRTGNLNIPINIAAVPSKTGLRFSLLAGFNSRNR
jgi:hypothetical protein